MKFLVGLIAVMCLLTTAIYGQQSQLTVDDLFLSIGHCHANLDKKDIYIGQLERQRDSLLAENTQLKAKVPAETK